MKSSNNKILTIAVILLLLINVAMIIFMVRGRNHHEVKRESSKTGPFEMMVKELNMTEEQKKESQQLREEHFKVIRPLLDSIRSARVAFFDLVKQPDVSDSVLSIYGKRITDLQFIVDKLTFAHFRRVRTLFTGDQQKKFDEFVQKMMQRTGGPGGRKKDSTGKEK